jgi:hypothetical protein
MVSDDEYAYDNFIVEFGLYVSLPRADQLLLLRGERDVVLKRDE